MIESSPESPAPIFKDITIDTVLLASMQRRLSSKLTLLPRSNEQQHEDESEFLSSPTRDQMYPYIRRMLAHDPRLLAAPRMLIRSARFARSDGESCTITWPGTIGTHDAVATAFVSVLREQLGETWKMVDTMTTVYKRGNDAHDNDLWLDVFLQRLAFIPPQLRLLRSGATTAAQQQQHGLETAVNKLLGSAPTDELSEQELEELRSRILINPNDTEITALAYSISTNRSPGQQLHFRSSTFRTIDGIEFSVVWPAHLLDHTEMARLITRDRRIDWIKENKPYTYIADGTSFSVVSRPKNA